MHGKLKYAWEIEICVGNWNTPHLERLVHQILFAFREIRGRVLVALADGTVGIFHRKPGRFYVLYCLM